MLSRASSVASTPYESYTGELVAPVNQQQQLGIGNINQYAGFAQPYISEAAGYARGLGTQISPADIQAYLNPYTQNVVDATQRAFNTSNQMQAENLKADAIAQGALGGSGPKIGQAILAGQQQQQQAPIIAGLYSSGYDKALAAAQQQKQNMGQAGYALGNLGISGQQAGLSGAGTQVGAGTLQQTTQQALDAANYQQFMQRQAFPYQQTQWLAGLQTGVGSQMGGTGTQTAPAPSPFAQFTGPALAAAGVFLNRGGRVPGYDVGGPVAGVGGIPYQGGVGGFIPGIAITPGRGAPQLGAPSQQGQSSSNATQMTKDAMGIAKSLSGKMMGPGEMGSPGVESPLMMLGSHGDYAIPTFMRRGGFVRGYDDGGPVTRAGFGLGSIVPDEEPLSFADRAAPAQEAITAGVFDPQGRNFNAFEPAPTQMAGVPLPRSRPGLGGDAEPIMLPPEITAGTSRPGLGAPPEPSDALAYDTPRPSAGLVPQTAPDEGWTERPPQQQQRSGLNLLGLSPEVKMGLIAAGLGMMASRSPHAGVAIGEGGLQGLSTYAAARRLEQDAQRVQAQMRRQDAQAAETAAHHRAQESHWKTMAERGKFQYLGPSADGTKAVFLDTKTGKTEERDIQIGAKPTAAKAIPGPMMKDLGEKAQTYSQLDGLVNNFKDNYAGWVSPALGDVANKVTRQTGLWNKDAANWWQDYARYRNVVRNKLFGSALTKHEIGEWEKADINPGMNPEVAKSNLERQRKLVVDGMKRRADSLVKQGYNKEAIEAEMGIPVGGPSGGLPKFKTPAEAQAAVKAGKIKKGDKFLDADGTERVVP